MQIFNRPEFMRHTWVDGYRGGRKVRKLSFFPGYIAFHDKNEHYMTANVKSRNEMLTDYLDAQIDQSVDEQPFLPRKPYLVGRGFNSYACINHAMNMKSLMNAKYMHHKTRQSLSVSHLRSELDFNEDDGHVWYLYNGKLLKITTSNREVLDAFDIIFRNSPEVRYAARL